MTRVIDRMEQVKGYDPGYTPVAIIGNLSDSRLSMERPGFEHLSMYGSNSYAVTYTETNTWYLWQVLGYPVNLVDFATHRELALREAEMWSVAAQDKTPYPMETLDKCWKGVLLNQFHDILPGSSIARVYEEARNL